MAVRRMLVPVLVFVAAAACGDDAPFEPQQPETTTTSPATTAPQAPSSTLPSTTAPSPPTTPAPETTATTPPPTTSTTTTTTVPFPGTADPKQGTMTGSPNGNLIDVRTGAHAGFTRIVWEMDGDQGTPWYTIGYADPPFADVADDVVPVDGDAFLRVVFFPGMRHDISDPSDIVQTYPGPDTIDVGLGSVVQVVFVDDFEANMEWAVGLTGVRPFHVFTLENPTRLVIDIAD